jgi:hypothetical protein
VVAVLPDPSLKRFERCNFAIALDEIANISRDGMETLRDRSVAPRWNVRAALSRMGFPMDAKLLRKVTEFAVSGMPMQEFLDVCSGEWEERVVNETDRGCGALDIDQNCVRERGFEGERQTQLSAGCAGR